MPASHVFVVPLPPPLAPLQALRFPRAVSHLAHVSLPVTCWAMWYCLQSRPGSPKMSEKSPPSWIVQNGTIPWTRQSCMLCSKHSAASAYHGSLTDQFRNRAARPSNSISVMKALPFVKKSPPKAGSIAKTSGVECQCEGSLWCWFARPSPGSMKSVAEDRTD